MAGSYVMGGIGFDKDLLFLQDPLCNPPVLIVVYVNAFLLGDFDKSYIIPQS